MSISLIQAYSSQESKVSKFNQLALKPIKITIYIYIYRWFETNLISKINQRNWSDPYLKLGTGTTQNDDGIENYDAKHDILKYKLMKLAWLGHCTFSIFPSNLTKHFISTTIIFCGKMLTLSNCSNVCRHFVFINLYDVFNSWIKSRV